MTDPRVHTASIPVTLKGGSTYDHYVGLMAGRTSEALVGLAKHGKRNVVHGGIQKVLEDLAEEEEKKGPAGDDEKKSEAVKKKKETLGQLHRASKGLAMELAVGAAFCFLDHPEQVLVNCAVNEDGNPTRAAAGRQCDIIVTPKETDTFQIICEASANRSMSDPKYRQQLNSALRHATKHHEEAGVDVTYVLLMNLREPSTDKRIHDIYKAFLQADEDDLWLWGPIRFVLMWSADLVAVINNLHLHEKLDFPTEVFAATLDELHRRLFEGDVPEEERWMEQLMIKSLLEGASRSAAAEDMFPAPKAVAARPSGENAEMPTP